ncbi:uncharacterized protein LOC134616539 isoform X2 [Pelmatolapia mariae]|uniref:uncharacterized protein LOC134616539 isoform X2 n=1 Tax=Pelmatolapia mariae TaxID=158779 RepID=UPI002FE6913D
MRPSEKLELGSRLLQVNAEFQRITTLQLETTFAAQLDRITPQLMTVFQKKGGVSGQKLAHHLQIMQEAESDVKVKREAVLRALCLYLGEEDGSLIREYLNPRTPRQTPCPTSTPLTQIPQSCQLCYLPSAAWASSIEGLRK